MGNPYEFLENKRRRTKEEQRGGRGLPGSDGGSWVLLGEGEARVCARKGLPVAPEAPTGRDGGVQGAVT